MSQKVVHIVLNPVAGQGTAKTVVQSVVEPLLTAAGFSTEVHQTQGVKDAGRIGAELHSSLFSASQMGGEDVNVVIAGGDGTAHEFIEGLYSAAGTRAIERRWQLAIIPLGTANALYASLFPPGTPTPSISPSSSIPPSSAIAATLASTPIDMDKDKLHSLLALLSNRTPRPLPISLLTISSPAGGNPSLNTEIIPSHVVVSTALHANLLATAEGLRAEYPGVERFKVAAQVNAGVFHPARVRLLPPTDSAVQIYDPRLEAFSNVGSVGATSEIEDEFAYLLCSTTTPRLEPTFVISPLLASIPPKANTMDVTILRPSRDPRVKTALKNVGHADLQSLRERGSDEERKRISDTWVPRAWEVLTKAYENGAHVNLTYALGEGGEVEVRGDGERVVEVYRVGGFEWVPTDPNHAPSHTVCADGSLHQIPAGGKAVVHLDSRTANGGFFVYA